VSDRYSADDLPVLEDLVDDLAAVLDEVGSERAALFGFSDAGALCAMFAATRPERVSGLILYSTAARGTQAPDYPWQWSEQEWQDYLRGVRAGWGTREYAQESLHFVNPSLAGDERMLGWWERFHGCPPARALSMPRSRCSASWTFVNSCRRSVSPRSSSTGPKT
jgi:pimeloyl-ACP methyl ester carboxylesterase